MHGVEKHLLDCQLCSDALEGLSSSEHEKIIAEINDDIYSRTNPAQIKFKYRTVAIAAMLLFSFGISFLIYKKISDSKKSETLVEDIKNNKITEPSNADINQDSISILSQENNKIGETKEAQTVSNQNNLIAAIPEKKNDKILQIENKKVIVPSAPKQIDVVNSVLNETTTRQPTDESINNDEIKNDDQNEEVAYEMLAESDNAPVFKATEESKQDKKSDSAPSSAKSIGMESKTSKKDVPRSENESINLAESLTENSTADQNIDPAFSSDNLFLTSMDKFNGKEYKEAAELFKQILKNNPQHDEAIYYGALSYYNLKEFKLAATYFEKGIASKKSPFFEDSQWYLALSFLENNETNKAKKLLKLIVDAQGKYELEAQQKLEKLK